VAEHGGHPGSVVGELGRAGEGHVRTRCPGDRRDLGVVGGDDRAPYKAGGDGGAGEVEGPLDKGTARYLT
jgi:hypothetical protein